MCGIVGVAGTGPMSLQMKEFFQSLLFHDVVRGHHATGVAAIDTLGRDLTVEKKAIDSPAFLQDKECMENLFNYKHNFNIYIGHNRWATSGAKDDDENAHPFIHGDIVGVHNGSLRQQYLLDDHKKFKVDSDNLYYHLSKNGLEDTVSKMNGAAALVWYDRSDNTLNFYRNDERPLAIAKLSNGYWVWASEIGMLRWLIRRHKTLSFETQVEKVEGSTENATIKRDMVFNLDKDSHFKITYKDHTRQYDGEPSLDVILPPVFQPIHTDYYGGNYRGRQTWRGNGTSHGDTQTTSSRSYRAHNESVQSNLDKFLIGARVSDSILEVEFQEIVHEKTGSGYEATIALFKYEAPNGKVVKVHAFVHNGVAFLKDWTKEKDQGRRVYGTICTVSPISGATYECTKNVDLGFSLSLNLLTENKPNKYFSFGKTQRTGGADAGKNVIPFQQTNSFRRPHQKTEEKAGSTGSQASSGSGVEGVDDKETFMSRELVLANSKMTQRHLISVFEENGCLCSNCGVRISQIPVNRLWLTSWFDRAEGKLQNYLSCSKSCFNMTEAVMSQLDGDYDKIFGGRDA